MINSIGLPNKGLRGYLAEDLPRLAELPVPLIVNVMGFTREEVATLVAAFAERDEVAALELNVSCPNVETGLMIGRRPAETAALLDAVRPLTAKPLIVKLTPNCTSPAAVAAAAEAARGRRGVADQHAARHGPAPAPAARAVARRRHRRRLRPRRARGRAGAGARRARAGLAPDRRHGRRPARPPRTPISCTPAQISSPSAPSRSGTRWPARGSRPSWQRFDGSAPVGAT